MKGHFIPFQQLVHPLMGVNTAEAENGPALTVVDPMEDS